MSFQSFTQLLIDLLLIPRGQIYHISFTHSFIHSLARSFKCNCSLINLFICSIPHTLIHSNTCSVTLSIIHLLIYLFNQLAHSFTNDYLITHSLTPSFARSLTHLFMSSFTHSFSHVFVPSLDRLLNHL